MSEDGKWDSESAAEAGRRSAEARRRKSKMTAEERALDAIGQKLGPLTKELLDAALGEGDFAGRWEMPPEGVDAKPVYIHGLNAGTRLTAILRAMEWRLGKPPTVKLEEPKEEAAPPTSESLFESS